MTEIKLDLKDRKILFQLDLNARQSNTRIAHKVGLSKDVVNYRIKKLEEQKIIKGYYSPINFYKIGYLGIRVYLKLVNTTPAKENEIIDYIVNDDKTFYAMKIDGPFDIGFGTWVKDIYEFESFYSTFKKEFKKYIGKDQISLFTKVTHFHRAYILDKQSDETVPECIGGKETEKIDNIDIALLKLIAKNSRISAVDMATKLKIPLTTIAFRIKKLEQKKIIEGYRFIFDFEKLGYEYYKVDIVLDETSRLNQFITYAHAHPNIVYIDQTIGASDFEFDLEVRNKKEFLKIIEELRQRFPEIREWSYFTAREFKKLLYFPAK